jgi:hypothetical protein
LVGVGVGVGDGVQVLVGVGVGDGVQVLVGVAVGVLQPTEADAVAGKARQAMDRTTIAVVLLMAPPSFRAILESPQRSSPSHRRSRRSGTPAACRPLRH